MHNAHTQNKAEKNKNKNKNKLFYVLIFFYFLEYIRPFDNYLSFLSALKITGLTGLFLFFIFISKPKTYLKHPVLIAIFLFITLMAIMVPIAINNHWAFKTTQFMWWTTFSVLCPTLYLLNTTDRIITFFKVWVFIMFGVCLIVISQGGTGPGSYIYDENDVACVITMYIPIIFFMLYHKKNTTKLKWIYIGIIFIMIIAVIATSSRGGFLGLVASGLATWWLCKSRLKNMLIIILISLVFGTLIMSLVPEKYIKDMQSISDTEDDTRNLRLFHWQTAWEIYKDNPIAGVGPYNYPWNHHHYAHLAPLYQEIRRSLGGRQSHSLYFTLIPELGTLGILLFIYIVWKTTAICFRLIRETKNDDSDEGQYINIFAKGLVAGLFSYLINGVFISVLYYPLMWHMVIFIIAISMTWDKNSKANNTEKISGRFN